MQVDLKQYYILLKNINRPIYKVKIKTGYFQINLFFAQNWLDLKGG